jgi:hypothetical protein
MSKAKKVKVSKSQRKTKRQPKSRTANAERLAAQYPDCPYRPATLYGTLFIEGSKDYIAKDTLIETVAGVNNSRECPLYRPENFLTARSKPYDRRRLLRAPADLWVDCLGTYADTAWLILDHARSVNGRSVAVDSTSLWTVCGRGQDMAVDCPRSRPARGLI